MLGGGLLGTFPVIGKFLSTAPPHISVTTEMGCKVSTLTALACGIQATRFLWILNGQTPYYAVPLFNQGNPDYALKSNPLWIALHLFTALGILIFSGLTVSMNQYMFKMPRSGVTVQVEQTTRLVGKELRLVVDALHFCHAGFCALVLVNCTHLVHFSPLVAALGNISTLALLTWLLYRKQYFYYWGFLMMGVVAIDGMALGTYIYHLIAPLLAKDPVPFAGNEM
jgi:hypothetical protein